MNRTRLYIDGKLADFDANTLVLLNWSREELDNPTIVKNMWSQSVELPATAANNKIFGHFFRNDRQVANGNFDALKKVDFALYSDASLIQKGYCKLDNIKQEGKVVTYCATLYGGLGSFLYNLSYDDEGNKKRLCDLDFKGTSALPQREFDFNITAQEVKNAWDALRNGTSGTWQHINFAPCYNGAPTTMDADKAVVNVSDISGIPSTSGDYSTKDGYALVKLNRKMTEWETKDLRCYMQRPVVRMKSIIDAIAATRNNGGWTVNLDSAFFNSSNPYYQDLWLTRPMLNTIQATVTHGGTQTATPASSTYASVPNTCGIGLPGTTQDITITNMRLQMRLMLGASGTLYGNVEMGARFSIIPMFQLVAYDAANNVVGATPMHIFSYWDTFTKNGSTVDINTVLQDVGITIKGNAGITLHSGITYSANGSYATPSSGDVIISMSAQNVHTLRIEMDCAFVMENPWRVQRATASDSTMVLSASQSSGGTLYQFAFQFVDNATNDMRYESSSEFGSGSLITKELLLNTTATPADYLLSYCKMFGLCIEADAARNTVNIRCRNSYYTGNVIDLTERVDMKQMSIVPHIFDSRWYTFGLKGKGDYLNAYDALHSLPYGDAKVNTGFSFNADTKELLTGMVLTRAAEVMERSIAFKKIVSGGKPFPACFAVGGTYSLWDSTGKNQDFALPLPTGSETSEAYGANSYDMTDKAELHEAENKPTDGADVPLLLKGHTTMSSGAYSQYRITNDSSYELALNGKRCWVLHSGTSLTTMPEFGRYFFRNGEIYASLDMGKPATVAIPNVTYRDGACLYDRFWRAYLNDRFNTDSRVMSARVDLRGLDVGAQMLRNFYFYDGAVWALNKIKDYNPCGDGLTTCEFVKVINTGAYTDGQTLDVAGAISVSPSTLTLLAPASVQQVNVNCSTSWTATGAPAWAQLSQSSGTGRTAVNISVSQNTTGHDRSGSITFRDSDNNTAALSLSQSSASISITPSTALQFQAKAHTSNQEASVTVLGGLNWNLTISQSTQWLTASVYHGEAGIETTVTFRAASDNQGSSQRTATVTVSDGTNSRTLSATQTEAGLEVSPTTLAFNKQGETKTLTINADFNWLISSKPEWLSASALSGNAGQGIQVTLVAPANTTAGNRNGNIILTAGTITRTVTVSQQAAAITVSPATVNWNATAGQSATIAITADASWGITAAPSWVSYPMQYGSPLILTSQVNTTGQNRQGVITFTMGNRSASVTINQAKATLTAAPASLSWQKQGGMQTMTVNANLGTYTVAVPDWITYNIRGNAVDLTATANEGAARSDTVRLASGGVYLNVPVSQAAAAASITVTPASQSFTSANGEAHQFTLVSQYAWSINNQPSWLTISPLSGAATGSQGVTVTMTTNSSNDSTQVRSGSVIFYSQEITTTVDVQQGGANAVLVLSPTTPIVVGAASGRSSFQITASNVPSWTVASSENWLHLETTSGSGTRTIYFTYDQSDGTARTATITVSGGGLAPTVTVQQTVSVLNIGTASIITGGAAGSQQISIDANVGWTAQVTEGGSWLTISPSSGSGNGSITASWSRNGGSETRVGEIRVTGGGITRTCSVSQAQAWFTVNPTTVNFAARPTASEVIAVDSNESRTWTAVKDASGWFSIADNHGVNHGTITVTAQKHTNGFARTGYITVTPQGGTGITVTVNQEAGVADSITLNMFRLDTYYGNVTTVRVTSNGAWTAALDRTTDYLAITPLSGAAGNANVSIEVLRDPITIREFVLTFTNGTSTAELPIKVIPSAQADDINE